MKNKNNQYEKDNRVTLDGIINDALKNLKNIIDSNTVIGQEVTTSDGTIIIPVSKIIVGFVAGGGEYENPYKKDQLAYPFAGGSGAGFTVVPIGFLTGKSDNLQFVSTKSDTKYDELINLTNKTLRYILDNVNSKK